MRFPDHHHSDPRTKRPLPAFHGRVSESFLGSIGRWCDREKTRRGIRRVIDHSATSTPTSRAEGVLHTRGKCGRDGGQSPGRFVFGKPDRSWLVFETAVSPPGAPLPRVLAPSFQTAIASYARRPRNRR